MTCFFQAGYTDPDTKVRKVVYVKETNKAEEINAMPKNVSKHVIVDTNCNFISYISLTGSRTKNINFIS